VDELRAAVRELADAPSAEQADSFVDRLARTPPSHEVAQFITQTLELAALHEVRDSRGVPLRWRLIDRLLGLGFPHALHVTPEDLDYHRLRSSGQTPAALTVGIAFLTTLWCFLWGAIAIGAGSGWWKRAVVGVIAAAIAHAVLAFLQALKASKGRAAPLLGPLGWAIFAGPLITFIVHQADHHVSFATFILGLPSMLTALLCAITAARLTPPVASFPGPVASPDEQTETMRPRARVSAR